MKFNILHFSMIICVFINAKDSYLVIRNKFLKFVLKLDNYRTKRILNNIGKQIDTMHYGTIMKIYNISYKYNTLTYDEQELFQNIGGFL